MRIGHQEGPRAGDGRDELSSQPCCCHPTPVPLIHPALVFFGTIPQPPRKVPTRLGWGSVATETHSWFAAVFTIFPLHTHLK